MSAMSNTNQIDDVKKLFSDYLVNNGHRQTPERISILSEIYDQDNHFSVELVYIIMKNRNLSISRATIYNTIELLIDCGLIIKHQFGKNIAQYEKSYAYKQHDHLICMDCGKVFEFCDPRIHQIQKTTEEMNNLKIVKHSLNFYGKCNTLEENKSCKYIISNKV